jgi:hypothetical protein
MTRQLQAGCTHQLRESLIVVEKDLPLRQIPRDLIYKEGETSKQDICREQVKS